MGSESSVLTLPDAEYVLLRSEAGVPIPETVSAAKYAPILCAGMTVFNSIRHMNVGVGETVAVQGLGGLGHLAIQYANKFGYRVVAISRGADKESFAHELGAHEYIDTSKVDAGEGLKRLGGASLVVTTSPNANTMSGLMQGLGLLGKLLILSVPGDVSVNTGVMVSELFCLPGRFGVEPVANSCLSTHSAEIWVVCSGVAVWPCYRLGGGNCLHSAAKHRLSH